MRPLPLAWRTAVALALLGPIAPPAEASWTNPTPIVTGSQSPGESGFVGLGSDAGGSTSLVWSNPGSAAANLLHIGPDGAFGGASPLDGHSGAFFIGQLAENRSGVSAFLEDTVGSPSDDAADVRILQPDGSVSGQAEITPDIVQGMAIDEAGVVGAAWVDSNSDPWVVNARKMQENGTLGPVIPIHSTSMASLLGMGVSPPVWGTDGTLTVIWNTETNLGGNGSGSTIEARQIESTGALRPAQSLAASGDHDTAVPGNAVSVAGPGGSVITAWSIVRGNSWDAEVGGIDAAGKAVAPRVIATAPVSGWISSPELAIAPDGTVTAVWVRNAGTFLKEDNYLETRQIRGDGSLTPPQTLFASGPRVLRSQVGVDDAGVATVAWGSADGASEIRTAEIQPDGSVGDTYLLDPADPRESSSGPWLTVSPGGLATVAWTTSGPAIADSGLYVSQSRPGATQGPSAAATPKPVKKSATAGDAVLDCGTARFDFYDGENSKIHVGNNDQACFVVVSNDVARGLIESAGNTWSKAWPGISTAFAGYFVKAVLADPAHTLTPAAAAAARYWLKRKTAPINLSKSLLRRLFPELADAFLSTDVIIDVGEVAALSAIPLGALYLDAVFYHQRGCAGFVVDLHHKFAVDWAYPVLNPSHAKDFSDTLMDVYQHTKGHYARRHLSIGCNAHGHATVRSPYDNAKVLAGAKIVVVK